MSVVELGDVDAVVRRALAEDLAAGDVTSRSTVDRGHRGRAEIVAKQDLIVSGGPVARRVFELVDPNLRVEVLVDEGSAVRNGGVIARVAGDAWSILAAERTALNFMQCMSGTATLTREFVDAAAGRCRITDTRKTTPGLRALERHAVRCGGGVNHRNDLGSGVLIKENHVRCTGGVRAAVEAALGAAPHSVRVQCEVTTLDELRAAIDAGADAVLLDNMDDEQIHAAVAVAGGRVVLEASGGMTVERVSTVAGLGIDLISVGALTHSAPSVDISLLFEPESG